MRLAGREVFFLSGTDEHGQKVEKAAKEKGMDPQAFVDEVSVNFRDLLDLLDVSNDEFIRTTDGYHKEAVQHLWRTLVENESIYLGAYEGWYSVRDECYYTESELIDGKAPTGAEVVWVTKEDSYFFKLSDFQSELLQFYDENPDFIAPASRRNEVLAFVQGGLRDLSISRTSFRWGVPVPGDHDHIMYVWIDALTNYLSAVGYPSPNRFWPASLHVVGKDILRFHAVYWPAFLMAARLPLPKRLFAHGWWTKDGHKISKSVGNVIDPLDLVHKYGVDPTRFFLMSEVNFGNDGDFSDANLIRKVNNHLSNELGNLCQRTLSMIFKNCAKAIPHTVGEFTHEDQALLSQAKSMLHDTGTAISKQEIHKYVNVIMLMVRETNRYIDEMAPWALKKYDPHRMVTVLYVITEILRRVAILYQPLMPSSSNKILDMLKIPQNERTFEYFDKGKVLFGVGIDKPNPVFPRLEFEQLLQA